jgi:hypothetical protein
MDEQDIKLLWKNQAVGNESFPLESLRRSVRRWRLGVVLWLALECVAFIAVLLFAIGQATHFSDRRFAAALTIFGVLIALSQLVQRAFLKPLPADALAQSWLDFRRAALAQQREAFLSAWLWYVLPVLPGFVAFQLATMPPGGGLRLVLSDAAIVVWAVGWRLLIAKFLQARINKLERETAA